MTNEQEYILFTTKLSNRIRETKEDFDKLSPDNQRLFIHSVNTALEAQGILLGIDAVTRLVKGYK